MSKIYTVLLTRNNMVSGYTGTLSELKKLFGLKIKGYNNILYNGEIVSGFTSPFRINELIKVLNFKYDILARLDKVPEKYIPRLSLML